MNVYKLDKKEYKMQITEFKKTYYGKNLYYVYIIMLVLTCLSLSAAGFEFGMYNDLTKSAINYLQTGVILLALTYIVYVIITIEIRKYIESKNKKF